MRLDRQARLNLTTIAVSFVPAKTPEEATESTALNSIAGQVWRVTKSYGHEEGLSCCFRQFQAAESHCRFLHGYALGFRFTFVAATLDSRGWCIDFGGLKPLRAWLHDMFDHTLLVAADDPDLPVMLRLQAVGLAQLRVLDAVGCEAFAMLALEWADGFVSRETGGRVRVEEVRVSEHSGNEASVRATV